MAVVHWSLVRCTVAVYGCLSGHSLFCGHLWLFVLLQYAPDCLSIWFAYVCVLKVCQQQLIYRIIIESIYQCKEYGTHKLAVVKCTVFGSSQRYLT